MTIPNGWHIKYNPKPIPIRGHDWDFWHDEVDNDSRLCGTAGSEEEAKLAIMEKQAERYGFDKHADKPDDFESHINIESLQSENATLKADLAALRGVEREKVAAWILSFGFATGHGDTIEDLLSEAGTQIQELRAAQEWIPVSERLPEQIGACLVCRIDSHGFREIAWAFFNSSQRFADTNSLHAAVTHWMPLPRQPEAEGHTT